MSARKILGVDPALVRTGWALLSVHVDGRFAIAATGSIACKGRNRGEKLGSVLSQFRSVILQWQPDEAHFELPGKWMHRYLSRNAVEAMAMARGVMLLACAERQIPAFEVDFHNVRREMLGGWKAGKSAAATYLYTLGITLPSRRRGSIDLDVVDAIMVALYAAQFSGNRDENASRQARFD